MQIKQMIRTVMDPTHRKRILLITLVVGLWLSLFNEGGFMVHGPWNAWLGGKIFLNFLTPYVVANLGLLAHGPAQAVPPRATVGPDRKA